MQLLPSIMKYGEYLCDNVSTKIINYAIANNISKDLKNQIVIMNEENLNFIDINTSILNSISSKTILQIQKYYEQLSNMRLDENVAEELSLSDNYYLYEFPLFLAFNNPFVSGLGPIVPIRYRLKDDITSEIVSELKEYGINNAILEVSLSIDVNLYVDIPIASVQKKVNVEVPLIIKLIQGEIPESFFGKNIIGGTK